MLDYVYGAFHSYTFCAFVICVVIVGVSKGWMISYLVSIRTYHQRILRLDPTEMTICCFEETNADAPNPAEIDNAGAEVKIFQDSDCNL